MIVASCMKVTKIAYRIQRNFNQCRVILEFIWHLFISPFLFLILSFTYFRSLEINQKKFFVETVFVLLWNYCNQNLKTSSRLSQATVTYISIRHIHDNTIWQFIIIRHVLPSHLLVITINFIHCRSLKINQKNIPLYNSGNHDCSLKVHFNIQTYSSTHQLTLFSVSQRCSGSMSLSSPSVEP